MKKLILFAVLILAPLLAAANTVTVSAVPLNTRTPQTCSSLSTYFGVTVTQMTSTGGATTLTCSPDWTPTSDQLATLTTMIQNGQ